MFGFPVASAGDVNKDRERELIVGARGADGGVGAAFVFACADVVPIGQGCGHRAPVLSSTPLAVGGRATLRLEGGERHAPAWLFASFVPALPTAVGTRCTVHLHAPSVLQMGTTRINGNGEARVRVDVPPAAELAGLELALQASVQSLLDPLVLSNGVIARIQR
jgi:hypothetical protein